MGKENEKTIGVYEKFGDRYLSRNEDDVKNNIKAKNNNDRHVRQLKKYLDGVPRNAKIFEVGSASGRDAKIIQSFG